MSNPGDGKIGLWAVVAIGIGGMVGGGIFAVLGLAVQLAHGGTITFLNRAFGTGMIIFLAYEGFELIANTAEDVQNLAHTLPRAYYIAVGFVLVLYVLVSLVTIGNLSFDKIVAARDYALSEAAGSFFGKAGFDLIAIGALLSTASAITVPVKLWVLAAMLALSILIEGGYRVTCKLLHQDNP